MQTESANLKNVSVGTVAVLAFCLIVPSLMQVQKYGGNGGVAIYLLVVPSILWVGYRYILPGLLPKITEEAAFWFVVCTLIAVLAVFVCLYPIAKSGVVGGGSDSDNALDIATWNLLRGRYPYCQRTYLGNPISPMPGSLLLAVPFVLLGASAYQNLFWIAALLPIARTWLKSGRLALAYLWTILALSPVVCTNLATGIDVLSNSIYVLVFMSLLVHFIPKPELGALQKVSLAALFGMGLSSRGHFVFIIPLVFSSLVQNAGWKCAVKYTALVCTVAGMITVPFYLYNPSGFSPLHMLGSFSQLQTVLPHVTVVMTISMAVIAGVLSFRRMDSGGSVLLSSCAILLSFPVLFLSVLASLQAHRLDLGWTQYGMSFLFFGVLASLMRLPGKASEPAASGMP